MSTFKTFRVLKRNRLSLTTLKKLFEVKSDEDLLRALANPDHSDEAKKILRNILTERGVSEMEMDSWRLPDKEMYVAPFGRQPDFETALAAPCRRRRLYRSVQGFLFAMVLGLFAMIPLAEQDYRSLLEQGISSGIVDQEVYDKLRNNGGDNENIYKYYVGRDIFVDNLEQLKYRQFINYVISADGFTKENYDRALAEGSSDAQIYAKLIGDGWTVPDEFYQSVFSQAWHEVSEQVKGSAALEVVGMGGLQKEDQKFVDALFEHIDTEYEILNNRNFSNKQIHEHFVKTAKFSKDRKHESVYETWATGLVGLGLFFWGIVGVFSWRNPSRILLLRPFQSKQVSKGLKRFVRKNIAFSGHTFTLADKYLKESFVAYIIELIPKDVPSLVSFPLSWIPAIRQFKRWIYVRKATHFEFLKNRLRRRYTMNVFWQNSINKILKVKSSDKWWKQCIDLLMFNCHVIVADLSWVKEGIEWELEKIKSNRLEEKTIFVVEEGQYGYAKEMIERYWPNETQSPPLHTYSSSGKVADLAKFEQNVARAISNSSIWNVAV